MCVFVIILLLFLILSYILFYNFLFYVLKNKDKKNAMFRSYFRTLNQWQYLNESKKTVADYLIKNGISVVAVYGFGHLGKHLFASLKNSPVKISFIIDKNKSISCEGIPVVGSDEQLDGKDFDLLIITPSYEFKNIRENYSYISDDKIISIEKLIENISCDR